MCELLTALHSDKFAPSQFKGKGSLLDKTWKQAWLGEVQNPLVASITYSKQNFHIKTVETRTHFAKHLVDRTAATTGQQIHQNLSEGLKTCFNTDSERLTGRIFDFLQQKSEATPAWPSRDKAVGLRNIRTLLLVVGELCGDLGEDFRVPLAFKLANSLLKRDAEEVYSNRRTNDRKNDQLTKDFKRNLVEMQNAMRDKALGLYDKNTELYDRIIDGKSMADVCEHDAHQIEHEILRPFATECNNWDITELTTAEAK